MSKIIIVEDELIVARDISKTLERNGYEVAGIARSVDAAMKLIEESKPWVVLLDIFLKGDQTGIDLALRLNKMGIAFIYISANSNQNILEAVKPTNPYGFIVKPFRERDLLVTLEIASYRYEANRQMVSQDPVHASIERVSVNDIIGGSSIMQTIFHQVKQVASSDTSVLLLGESGTGKELVANYIVQQSARRDKPFIKVNCAAIPDDLMEAEFFGYEKGTFTGALNRHPGKFEAADGGTILLDEVGDMPFELQSKLLRFLQEKEVQRLGGNETIKIDARIIAATGKSLEKEVAEGRFRLDLYYRLHVFPIILPPLRERKEDIPALTRHFVKKFSQKTGRTTTDISERALSVLLTYDWPGNVRELEHVIERTVLLAKGTLIEQIQLDSKENLKDELQNSGTKSLDELERDHILEVLRKTKGRIEGPLGAAVILKVSPSTLHSKIKKLGIKVGYE